MKNRDSTYLKILISICLLALMAGCGSPVEMTETATSTQAPPTHTPTATMPPTTTTTPTLTPTVTLTLNPLTWTPLPTLSREESRAMVQELLETNRGCQLPCWWGITPGETDWQTAQQFLATFATRIEQVENTPLITRYSVEYHVPGWGYDEGYTEFSVRDGMVTSMSVNTVGTELSYQLHQVLSVYGKPTEIFLDYDVKFESITFYMALYYPEQGNMAIFSGPTESIKIEGTENVLFRFCPQHIGPSLELWSPDEELTEEDLQELFPWYLIPLNTNVMEINDFYKLFLDPNVTECIEN